MNTLKYNSGGGYMWYMKRFFNGALIAIPEVKRVIQLDNIAGSLEEIAEDIDTEAIGKAQTMPIETAKNTIAIIRKSDKEWTYKAEFIGANRAVIAVYDENNEFLGYL